MTCTIQVDDPVTQLFSPEKLSQFLRSEDFQDLILGYQMQKGETGITQSFQSFKQEVGY